eukprot:scaffold5980_cov192-Amphora_coffeaeformis.AAC.8
MTSLCQYTVRPIFHVQMHLPKLIQTGRQIRPSFMLFAAHKGVCTMLLGNALSRGTSMSYGQQQLAGLGPET